jgi:DNA polymerase III subunit chi
MRVDFYQLSRDPAETALPLLARAALNAGQRMVVVSDDRGQLERIDRALWERQPESFLAHGFAGGEHDARQPVLLSDRAEAGNGAKLLAIADGVWRDTEGFERVLYLFDEKTLVGARRAWVLVGEREGLERKFWKQDGGKWVEGP